MSLRTIITLLSFGLVFACGAIIALVVRNEAASGSDQALVVGLGLTAGLAVVSAVVAWFVAGSATRPLSRLVDAAVALSHGDYDRATDIRSDVREVAELAEASGDMRRRLAHVAEQARRMSSGDLSQRVEGAGQLGDAFNAMAESLSRLAAQLQGAIDRVGGAASEIFGSSRHAERGSAEQASSIAQTTTTMDELLSASKQIASSADAVVKIAERTLQAAKSGEDAVQQSIAGMQEIASNNRQTAERILELSERNQQIGNIVDLIDEIADKSDLLALNAAIEGARAGEAGKGFAVVATEMRSLAENVVESTKEIKALITEIQKASNASVLATEGQMKATERGTQIALRTGEQLREILQMVVQTTEAAKQISLATQQQRTGTEQVVQSMAEIARIARANVAGAAQTTTSTSELARLSEELKQAVGQFRVAR
jgi:methyl-accepting chemotaxis protein